MDAPEPPPARYPVETGFDTGLFALIALCLILGPPLVGLGYDVALDQVEGGRRWYSLGLFLTFGIAVPAMVLYNLTEGAWVLEAGPPPALAWRRRFGPLSLPGTRYPADRLAAIAVGGHVTRVDRGERTEPEWSYQAFLATRDGQLLPAGPVHKRDPKAADADARALAGALGVPFRPGGRTGIRMVRAPSGEWQVAEAPDGTDTGWSGVLAVVGVMLAFLYLMFRFVVG